MSVEDILRCPSVPPDGLFPQRYLAEVQLVSGRTEQAVIIPASHLRKTMLSPKMEEEGWASTSFKQRATSRPHTDISLCRSIEPSSKYLPFEFYKQVLRLPRIPWTDIVRYGVKLDDGSAVRCESSVDAPYLFLDLPHGKRAATDIVELCEYSIEYDCGKELIDD